MYTLKQIKKGIRDPRLISGEVQRQFKELYFRGRAEIPHDIGIKGNYQTGNIGDRAIGEILQKKLSNQKNTVKLFDKETKRSRAPVRILGGGGVFYDRFGVDDLYSRVNYVLNANKSGIIGVGVPGFTSTQAEEYLRETLQKIDLITVRSERDADILKDICDTQVHTTACPAMLYEDPSVETTNKTGINFRPWFYYDSQHLSQYFDYDPDLKPPEANEQYIENAQKIIDNVENPTFIPFQKKDEQFAKEHLDIEILPYRFSVEKTLERISSVEKMVSTRYHSLIFAAVCDKPILAISYAPKVSAVAERLNIHHQKPHSENIEIYFDNVENMSQVKEDASENIRLIELELLQG